MDPEKKAPATKIGDRTKTSLGLGLGAKTSSPAKAATPPATNAGDPEGSEEARESELLTQLKETREELKKATQRSEHWRDLRQNALDMLEVEKIKVASLEETVLWHETELQRLRPFERQAYLLEGEIQGIREQVHPIASINENLDQLNSSQAELVAAATQLMASKDEFAARLERMEDRGSSAMG